MSTTLKAGDKVRIIHRRAPDGRSAVLGRMSGWCDVVAVDGAGLVQVRQQRLRRAASGAFAADRTWHLRTDLWTEEDEREASQTRGRR